MHVHVRILTRIIATMFDQIITHASDARCYYKGPQGNAQDRLHNNMSAIYFISSITIRKLHGFLCDIDIGATPPNILNRITTVLLLQFKNKAT